MRIIWQGKRRNKNIETEIVVFQMFDDDLIAFVAHKNRRTKEIWRDHKAALTILRDVDFSKEQENVKYDLAKENRKRWKKHEETYKKLFGDD